jgi:hypothetical protein
MSESQPGKNNPQNNPQGKPSGDAQDKAAKAPTGETEEPKYTETQWRDMQSKIRKSEADKYKALQDKYDKLETDNLALQSVVDDNEALKSAIADLNGKFEEGIPDDAKGAFKQWGKDLMATKVEHVKLNKQLREKDSALDGYKKGELKTTAEKLAKGNTELLEKLLMEPDVTAMKAYAFDYEAEHPQQTQTTQPSGTKTDAQTTPSPTPAQRPPIPIANAGGVTQGKSDEEKIKERYPSMFPK